MYTLHVVSSIALFRGASLYLENYLPRSSIATSGLNITDPLVLRLSMDAKIGNCGQIDSRVRSGISAMQ